ncbi:MAG: HDOD domain-containing protein [Phycisphaerales bacterium]
MSEDQLKRILQNPALPTLPAVAVRVLELAGVPDVPLSEIASTVSLDQAMAGRILKTVNSSYYGLTKPVASIDRAMGYLGMNTVKTLVLSFSLVDTFGPSETEEPAFDLVAHWRRAIQSACAARLFAETLGGVEADDAFIAALMQDIGVLALYATLGDEYERVIAGLPHAQTIEAEVKAFGFDHAMVGGRLCEMWRLPESICEAVRCHHATHEADAEHAGMIGAIELASLTAELLAGEPAPEAGRNLAAAGGHPALADGKWEQVVREAAAGAEELSASFKIDIGDKIDPDAVLASASELLLRNQIESDRRTSDLERMNQELRHATKYDALTGAHNRAAFDQDLSELFERARASGRPMAVLFFDADRFKAVNDTHGHKAGDIVLVELARRAQQATPAGGTVYRYGGEEFAVILPGHDRKRAGLAGEALRRAIESGAFDVRGSGAGVDELPVTVSVGVAAFDQANGGVFKNAEQLLLSADKAVYAAKKAGRNCVRVFSPRVGGTRSGSNGSQRSGANGDGGERMQHRAHRILLIEDDPMHAMLIAMMGRSIPGLTIDIAASGEEAIRRLKEEIRDGGVPDAILSDLGLPGMSGLDVIAWIRAHAPQSLPVIVVTAQEGEAQHCLSAGASAYIEKAELCTNPRDGIINIIEEWCTGGPDASGASAPGAGASSGGERVRAA